MAMLAMGFGMIAIQLGDYDQARTRFEQGLDLFQKIGDKYRVNMVRSELAHIERRQNHYRQALPIYNETILAWRELGSRAAVAHQLECFAFTYEALRHDEHAVHLLGAAEALREKITIPMTPLERKEYDRVVASLRTRLNKSLFSQAWSEGREMTMDQAVAYALETESKK
jgi:tetratricopeptide (TPR) repeat protein